MNEALDICNTEDLIEIRKKSGTSRNNARTNKHKQRGNRQRREEQKQIAFQHRHHNSKRAPSLLSEGEMLLNLGITTNITTF